MSTALWAICVNFHQDQDILINNLQILNSGLRAVIFMTLHKQTVYVKTPK